MISGQFWASVIQEHQASQQQTLTLRAGQMLNGEVLRVADNMALLQIGGFKLHAKLETALQVGQKSWFQVMNVSDPVTLRVLPIPADHHPRSNQLQQLLLALGMRDNADNQALIRAFLQAKIPLQQSVLQQAQTVMRDLGPANQNNLSTILMIVQRGLPLTTQTAQALRSFLYQPPLTQQLDTIRPYLSPQQQQTLNQLFQPIAASSQQSATGFNQQALSTFMTQLGMHNESGMHHIARGQARTNGADIAVRTQGMPLAANTNQAGRIPSLALTTGLANVPVSSQQNLASQSSVPTSQSSAPTSQSSAPQQSAAPLPSNQPMLMMSMLANLRSSAETLRVGATLAGNPRAGSSTVMNPALTGFFAQIVASSQQVVGPQAGQLFASQPTVMNGQALMPQTSSVQQAPTIAASTTSEMNTANRGTSNYSTAVLEWLGTRMMGSQPSQAILSQLLELHVQTQPNLARSEANLNNVKMFLQQLLQEQSFARQVRASMEFAVQHITGQQLLVSTEHSTSPFYQLLFQLPVQYEDRMDQVYARMEGQKNAKSKISAEDCRMLFYVQLKALGELCVDIHIHHKNISITVYNEQELQGLLTQFKPQLTDALYEMGYRLIGLGQRPLEHVGKQMKSMMGSSQTASEQYQGVDVRI